MFKTRSWQRFTAACSRVRHGIIAPMCGWRSFLLKTKLLISGWTNWRRLRRKLLRRGICCHGCIVEAVRAVGSGGGGRGRTRAVGGCEMPTVGVGLGGLFRLLAPRADWNNRQRFAGFSRSSDCLRISLTGWFTLSQGAAEAPPLNILTCNPGPRVSTRMSIFGRNRDDRRRRNLAEDLGSENFASSATAASKPTGKAERYTAAGRRENRRHTSDFIPRRGWSLAVWFAIGLSMAAGLLVGFINFGAEANSEIGLGPLLNAAQGDSLAGWFSSLMFTLAAVGSVLVYSIRRHRCGRLPGELSVVVVERGGVDGDEHRRDGEFAHAIFAGDGAGDGLVDARRRDVVDCRVGRHLGDSGAAVAAGSA